MENIAIRVVIGLLTLAFITIGFVAWHITDHDAESVRLIVAAAWVFSALLFALLGNISGAIREKA